MTKGPEVTVGEYRVRTQFNPSGQGVVDRIKDMTAQLIDLCDNLKNLEPRLAAEAMTRYEDAAHWAVKLATSASAAKNPDAGS